jgi:hypothetical protein
MKPTKTDDPNATARRADHQNKQSNNLNQSDIVFRHEFQQPVRGYIVIAELLDAACRSYGAVLVDIDDWAQAPAAVSAAVACKGESYGQDSSKKACRQICN